jgi:glutamate-1-semialdehyde 2,1-aminomutase
MDDGWWWHTPALTNNGIRKQILRELLAARFPRLLRPPGHAVS